MAGKNKRKTWKYRQRYSLGDNMADQQGPNSPKHSDMTQSQPLPGNAKHLNEPMSNSYINDRSRKQQGSHAKTKLGSQDVIHSIMKGSIPPASPRVTRSMSSQDARSVGQMSGRGTDRDLGSSPALYQSKYTAQFSPRPLYPTPMLNLAFGGSELGQVEKLIDEKDRGDSGAISDALNKMHLMMVTNQHSMMTFIAQCDRRFEELYLRADSVDRKVASIDQRVQDQSNMINSLQSKKAAKEEVVTLKGDLNDLKNYVLKQNVRMEESLTSLDTALKCQSQSDSESKLEIKRLYSGQASIAERLNARDIRDNRLFFFIDGLPEDTETDSTIQTIISRFNTDAGSDLKAEDFATAYRLGKLKTTPEGQTPTPRQIKVKVRNDDSRNKLLACRGKLTPNADKSIIG